MGPTATTANCIIDYHIFSKQLLYVLKEYNTSEIGPRIQFY